ncbi:Auxin response factor 6 [Vitis vinifera]|uniref:Auxin response factor 6 n=1 Tax=Vitis vinifera TaxID=29760 RepID=A0A438HNE2_VITVI|nr:Auxin response factor 6 [Vitis vinifera]
MQSLLGSFSQDGTSHLLNLHGSNPVEELATPPSNASELSTLLPPFPGREYSVYQGVADPQNNLLFGVNIDSSSLMLQNGMSNLRSIGSENDSVSMPFSTPNFANAPGTDFPLNSDMTTSSSQVRVFGRSLDITKFSSYDELRGELGRMFGLEGRLEDPLRSGWQLVFVDRENDVLLLGDDPWQEFVNNVWYIKILSPLEVQQMGKEGINVPNPIPSHRISNSGNSCDDY